MVENGFMVPLSPPTSPRTLVMSRSEASGQKQLSRPSYSLHDTSHRDGYPSQAMYHANADVFPNDSQRHVLRPQKSFSYFQGAAPDQHLGLNLDSDDHVSSRYYPFPQHMQSTHAEVSHSTASAGSAPPSPVDRLTPRSAEQSVKADDDDEEMVDSGGDDEGDAIDKVNMTPAEIHAQKRKMKRHRLTHTQTRFLVSEFARQAHPDAAHRDRLAREIPGLSSRQVQVWFQNRRAKLKRCSTADRDRIMRSRALPADFDNTKALRSQYGASPSSMSAPGSAMGGLPTFADHAGGRALSLEATQRMSDYDGRGHVHASATGVSPALGSFAFTPPASEHISPDSGGILSPYVLQHASLGEGSRRHVAGMPLKGHGYNQQSSSYRLPYQERLVRNAADVTSSSLRGSVSHSGLRSTSDSLHSLPERSSSFPEHTSQERSGFYTQGQLLPSGASEQDSYGLGFSYYQQDEHLHQQLPASTAGYDALRRTSSIGSMYHPFATPGYTPSTYGQYAPQQLSAAIPSEYHSQLSVASVIEDVNTSHAAREYQPLSAPRAPRLPRFATGDSFTSSFQ